MQSAIVSQVIESLKNTYGFSEVKGGWLRKGECPECHKKELFTKIDGPWLIRCGRPAKCGWEGETKRLFPHLFESFNKRYKPTEQDPNATAKAYLMHARGFEPSKINGWYEQGKFWHPDADKGTATVRFYLDDAHSIYMERFVEVVTITDPDTGERKKRKAHFKGSHKGLWWQPPGFNIEPSQEGDPIEIWIVEACLDAIALNINGIHAVASLSTANYPDKKIKQYQGKNVRFVWALDNDKAGVKATKKHVKRMRMEGYNVSAAQPGKSGNKLDWNDLHQKNALEKKHIEKYRYLGELLIARSSTEKALLIYNFDEKKTFHFEFNHAMYWFSLDLDKLDKKYDEIYDEQGDVHTQRELRDKALEECGTITRIANCYFQFLYYQANLVTDESWYYAQVTFPHGNNAVKNTFTGSQISSSSEFKKRLISIAVGGMWMGQQFQLDRIIESQTNNLKVVQTIDYIGYSKDHRCYVLSDLAIKDGDVIELNEQDYFDLGKSNIKSLQKSVTLNVNSNLEQYRSDWPSMIHNCFGVRGVINVAFWFGSFFAEQIRERHGSFPIFIHDW